MSSTSRGPYSSGCSQSRFTAAEIIVRYLYIEVYSFSRNSDVCEIRGCKAKSDETCEFHLPVQPQIPQIRPCHEDFCVKLRSLSSLTRSYRIIIDQSSLSLPPLPPYPSILRPTTETTATSILRANESSFEIHHRTSRTSPMEI